MPLIPVMSMMSSVLSELDVCNVHVRVFCGVHDVCACGGRDARDVFHIVMTSVRDVLDDCKVCDVFYDRDARSK